MDTKRYILSPCGISLLTNQAQNNEERKLVFKYANEKGKDSITDEDRVKLEDLLTRTSAKVDTADYRDAMKMSAELHGIVQIYDGSFSHNSDVHFLLSTDTWLGEETATLVEKWIKSKNQNMMTLVHRHIDLQTKDMLAFQLSLSELIKKFSKEIPSYSKKGYKVIFNVTGGFKSVQGFLQSIANFYADETVYIFETSSELMRIPRLPIRMDAMHIIEENITSFRNLSLGLPVSTLDNIPETLLFTMEGQTIFSPWGELIWSTSKSEIYQKRLLPSPAPKKIKYGKGFEKEVKLLSSDRIEMINHRIDQLNKHLNDSAYNPDSLDFKQLKGKPMKLSTHEMDAWADSDAKRIYGHFENGVFVLDKLDKGLH